MTERHEEDLREDLARETEGEEDLEMLERLLAQPFDLGQALREETDGELQRRDGEWSAFTSGVFRQIDDAKLEAERKSLEDQAIATLKAEVEAELTDVAPTFEGAFRSGVEQRIWQAAKARPSLGERVSEWLGSLLRALTPSERMRFGGYGLAAAAAAVAMAIALGGVFSPSDDLTMDHSSGVSIDRVSFEGSVTVLQEDGIPVVWLADEDDSAL